MTFYFISHQGGGLICLIGAKDECVLVVSHITYCIRVGAFIFPPYKKIVYWYILVLYVVSKDVSYTFFWVLG